MTSEQATGSEGSETDNAATQDNTSFSNLSDSENPSQKEGEDDTNDESKPKLCFDMRNAKGATEAWKNVDETYKKQARSLKETHVKYAKAIEDMVKKAAKKKVKDRSSKKEWVALFKWVTKSRRTNKNIISFGLSLAITDPDFFPYVEWRGTALSALDEINVAWAAAQAVFGSVWRTQPAHLYDTLRFPKQITHEGLTFIQRSDKMEPPFLKDDIFNDDDPNCLHDTEARVRRLVEENICPCKVLPDWEFVIRMICTSNYFRITDDTTKVSLEAFAMRLLRTDPKEAFGDMAAAFSGKLPCNALTTAWAAVYNVMGCGWTVEAGRTIQDNLFGSEKSVDRFAGLKESSVETGSASKRRKTWQDFLREDEDVPMTEPEIQVVTPAKDAQQATDSREATVEKPKSILKASSLKSSLLRKNPEVVQNRTKVSIPNNGKNPINRRAPSKPREKRFLSLPKVKKTTTTNELLNALHGKKFITYLKIKLPKWVHTHNTVDSEQEVIEKFSMMVETVFEIDSAAYIIPWKNESKVTKISGKNFNGVPSRGCANMYCDNLFIKKDMNSWIRIKVAHDSDRLTWDDQEARDRFKSKDMFGAVDRIQAQKQACAGWLLGSHPTTDCRKLEQALKLHSQLKNVQLEVRLQVIKLDNSSKIPYEELVKVCHIHTDFETVHHIRAILNKIYGHSNVNGDYPLGKNMRFVPHVADIRLRPSQAAVNRACRCVSKQRLFLEKTVTQTTTSIDGLDYVAPGIGISLREACMRIQRSDKDAPTSLFIAIDETWNGMTSFLFKKDAQKQAKAVIQTLPIVLMSQWNDSVYNWFVEGTEATMEGYYWDEEAGMVRASESAPMDCNWAFDDESLSESSEVMGYEGDVLIEDFQVFMAQDVPSSQQYSGGRSVGTFRSVCNKDSSSVANTSITCISTDTSHQISSITDSGPSLGTEASDAKVLEQIYGRNPQLLEKLLDTFKTTPDSDEGIISHTAVPMRVDGDDE